MTIKRYPIALEVSGPLGMFADSLSGSEAVSYPLPPISACRGMIDSIIYCPNAELTIVGVATCRLPRWVGCAYNSFSPYRVEKTVASRSACQIRESMLENPCFQILAYFTNKFDPIPVNHAHSTQDRFFRRLKRGQTFNPISLGRKECLAFEWGVPKTPVEKRFSSILGCMVQESLQGDSKSTQIQRVVHNNVFIEQGVLKFKGHENETILGDDGLLKFADNALQFQIDHFTRVMRDAA
jgi:CRISPR-associated Cas5-like protein